MPYKLGLQKKGNYKEIAMILGSKAYWKEGKRERRKEGRKVRREE